MNEFIRDNLVFVAQGSRMDPLNQRCTLVQFYPSASMETNGRCEQILLTVEEAESLHSFLGVWLQENSDVPPNV